MPFDNEFTIGIEEEFQIIDPQTRELRSRVNEILDEGRMLLAYRLLDQVGGLLGRQGQRRDADRGAFGDVFNIGLQHD